MSLENSAILIAISLLKNIYTKFQFIQIEIMTIDLFPYYHQMYALLFFVKFSLIYVNPGDFSFVPRWNDIRNPICIKSDN